MARKTASAAKKNKSKSRIMRVKSSDTKPLAKHGKDCKEGNDIGECDDDAVCDCIARKGKMFLPQYLLEGYDEVFDKRK